MRSPPAPRSLSPVVVKPGSVAGDDDVVGLLSDIVLSRVNGAALVSLVGVLVLLGHRGDKTLRGDTHPWHSTVRVGQEPPEPTQSL